MFDTFLTKLITRHLSQFCEYDSLKTQGVGYVEINGLHVKPELFPANLPAKLVEVSVGKAVISISALKMFSLGSTYAIQVHFDSVYVLLTEFAPSEFNETQEFKNLRDAKLAVIYAMRQSIVDAVTTKLTKLEGKLAAETGESSFMSFIKSIGVRVAKNVEVTIRDLQIVYQMPNSEELDIGVYIPKILLKNCDVEPEIDIRTEGKTIIGGLIVEPVQGNLSKIVQKALFINNINIRRGGSNVLVPFHIETLFSLNLAGDPRPTLGIIEMRFSKVQLCLRVEDTIAFGKLLRGVSRVMTWKQYCQERFEGLIERQVSVEDKRQCFALYERMVHEGTQAIKDNNVIRPKKASIYINREPEALLAELSWLEQKEIFQSIESIQLILDNVSHVLARRQMEAVDVQENATQPNKPRGMLSWMTSWFSSDTPSEEEIVKTARDLSAALGIFKPDTIEDKKKSEDYYRKIFNAIDTNSRGCLNTSDIQKALALAGTALSPSRVRGLIDRLDIDKNGNIGFEEFCEMCELAPESVARNDFELIGFSCTIEGFQMTLFDRDTEATRHFGFSMDHLRLCAGVENPKNTAIGCKSFDCKLSGMAAYTQNGTKKVPIFTYSNTTDNVSWEAESNIRIGLHRIRFDVDVANHYAVLFELDQNGEPVSHVLTNIGEKQGKDLASPFIFEYPKSQELLVNMIHTADKAKLLFRLEIRKGQMTKSQWSSMLYGKSAPLLSMDDELLYSMDIEMPLEVDEQSKFSRFMDDAPVIVTKTQDFEGGNVAFGVTIQSRRRYPKRPLQTPAFIHVSGICRDGVGCSECALGVTVNVAQVEYRDDQIVELMNIIETHQSSMQNNDTAPDISDGIDTHFPYVFINISDPNREWTLECGTFTLKDKGSPEGCRFLIGQFQNLNLLKDTENALRLVLPGDVQLTNLPSLKEMLDMLNRPFKKVPIEGVLADGSKVPIEISNMVPEEWISKRQLRQQFMADWFESKPADPIGLAVYPRLIDQEIGFLRVRAVTVKDLVGANEKSPDAFCEMHYQKQSFATEVLSKGENNEWVPDTSTFRFGPVFGSALVPESHDIVELEVKSRSVGGLKTTTLGLATVSLHDMFVQVTEQQGSLNRSPQYVIDDSRKTILSVPLNSPTNTATGAMLTLEVSFQSLEETPQPISSIPTSLELTMLLDIAPPTIEIIKHAALKRRMQLAVERFSTVICINGGCLPEVSKQLGKRNKLFSKYLHGHDSKLKSRSRKSRASSAQAPSPRNGMMSPRSGMMSPRSGMMSPRSESEDPLTPLNAPRTPTGDSLLSPSSSSKDMFSPAENKFQSVDDKVFSDMVPIKLKLPVGVSTNSNLKMDSVPEDSDALEEKPEPELKLKLRASKVRRTKVSFDFELDTFKLVLYFISSVDGTPYESLAVVTNSICSSCFYSIFHDRMPSFQVYFSVDDFAIRDSVQKHNVIGRELATYAFEEVPAKNKIPQIRMSLTYDSLLVDAVRDQAPVLQVAFAMNKMFVLATSLLQMYSRLQLSLVPTPVTEDVSASLVDSNTETVRAKAASTASVNEQSSGMLLPISALEICVGFVDVEVHLSTRRYLVFEYRSARLPKLPPRSLIFKFSTWCIFSISLPLEESEYRTITPAFIGQYTEIGKINIVTEVSSELTRLTPDCFTEEPSNIPDFTIGGNTLLHPSELLIVTTLAPVKGMDKVGSFRDLCTDPTDLSDYLLEKYSSNISEYVEELGDSLFEENDSPNEQDENHHDEFEGSMSADAKYSIEIEKEMKSQRDKTLKEVPTDLIRELDITLSSLEIGLEPVEYHFMNEIVEYNMLLANALSGEIDDAATSKPKPISRDNTPPPSERIGLLKDAYFEFEGVERDSIRKLPSETVNAILGGSSFSTQRSSAKFASDTIAEALQDGQNERSMFGFAFPSLFPQLILCPVNRFFRDIQTRKVAEVERERALLVKLRDTAEGIRIRQAILMQFRIVISHVLICVANNNLGFPSPFMRCSMSKMHIMGATSKSLQDELFSRGFISISVSAFNHLSRTWEPFVEPWAAVISAEKLSDSGLVVACSAPQRLNLNVTDGFFHQLHVFQTSWDPETKPLLDERLTGKFCPNWIVNETGHSLTIWPVLNARRQMEKESRDYLVYRGENQFITVENDQATSIHLHDTRRIRDVANTLVSQLIEHRKRLAKRALKLFQTGAKKHESEQSWGEPEDTSLFSEGQLKNAYETLFHKIDEDHSGEITAIELHRALMLSGEPISIREVVYLLGELDEEGVENVDAVSTVIDIEEFLAFFVPEDATGSSIFNVDALSLELGDFPVQKLTDSGSAKNPFMFAPCSAMGYSLLHNGSLGMEEHLQHSAIGSANGSANLKQDSSKKLGSRRRSSKEFRLTNSGMNLLEPKEYRFIRAPNTLCVIANNRKMGVTSVSDVLFLETPIRLENRSLLLLNFFVQVRSVSNQVKSEEFLFELEPGDEQSVPLKYLYLRQLGDVEEDDSVVVVMQPRLNTLVESRLTSIEQTRWTTLNSGRKLVLKEAASFENENALSGMSRNISSGEQWPKTEPLIELLGGQSVRVVPLFEKHNRMLDPQTATPIFDLDVNEGSGIVGATPVGISKNDRQFELCMLSQRNSMTGYDFCETLTVRVMSANKLIAADSDGMSDPYVKVKYGAARYRTPTMFETLTPRWPRSKSTFTFVIDKESDSPFIFTIFDHDRIGKDDELGQVIVSLDEIRSLFESPCAPRSISKVYNIATTPNMEEQATGTLRLQFELQNFNTKGRPLNMQHVFSFYPSLTIENGLPFALQVRIGLDGVEPKILSIPLGATLPVYGFDSSNLDFLDETYLRYVDAIANEAAEFALPPEAKLVREHQQRYKSVKSKVAFRLYDSAAACPLSEWSEDILKPNVPICLTRFHAGKQVSEKSEFLGSVLVEVTRAVEDGGGRRLVVYAPYWVINKSDMILQYSAADVNEHSIMANTSKTWHEPEYLPNGKFNSIVPLAFENQDQIKLSIRGKTSRFPTVNWMNCSVSVDLVNDGRIQSGAPVPLTLSCKARGSTTSDQAIENFLQTYPDTKLHESQMLVIVKSVKCAVNKTARYVISAETNFAEETQEMVTFFGSANENLDEVTWPMGAGIINIPIAVNMKKSDATITLSLLERSDDGAKVTPKGDLKISLEEVFKSLSSDFELQKDFDMTSGARVSLFFKHVGVACTRENLHSVSYSSVDAELSLQSEPAYDKYNRTTVITIGPRFFMSNKSKEPILVKQAGLPDSTAIYFPPTNYVTRNDPEAELKFPWHFTVSASKAVISTTITREVQIALAHPQAAWSNPFPLDDVDDFGLQLRAQDQSRMGRVWIDANHSGPSDFFVFRSLSFNTIPLAVQNLCSTASFAVLQVQGERAGIVTGVKNIFKGKLFQRDSKVAKREFTASNIVPDILEPCSEMALPLDILPTEKGVRVTILVVPLGPNGEMIYNRSVNIRFKKGLREKIKLDSHNVELAIVAFGSKLVLRMSDERDSGSVEIQQHRYRGVKKEIINRARIYDALTPKYPNLEALLSLSSVGISLFSTNHATEIAYVFFQRIHVEVSNEIIQTDAVKSSRSTLEFSLGNFQIDSSTYSEKSKTDQEHGGLFPVVVSTDAPDGKIHVCPYCLKKFRSVHRLQLHESSRHRLSLLGIEIAGGGEIPTYPMFNAVSDKSKSVTALLGDDQRKRRLHTDALQVHRVVESEIGNSSAFDIVRYLEVKLQPVHIYIDGQFLAGILMLTDESEASQGSIEGEGEVLGSDPVKDNGDDGFILRHNAYVSAIPVPLQDSIYVESAEVHKTAFVITVNIGKGKKLSQMLKPYGISPFSLFIAKRVARVDLFCLDISEGSHQNLSMQTLQQKLRDGLIMDITSQLHEVIGNVTFRISRKIGIMHYHDFEKIREPQRAEDDIGAIAVYGPGSRPRLQEIRIEKDAALKIETWYLRRKAWLRAQKNTSSAAQIEHDIHSRSNESIFSPGKWIPKFRGNSKND